MQQREANVHAVPEKCRSHGICDHGLARRGEVSAPVAGSSMVGVTQEEIKLVTFG